MYVGHTDDEKAISSNQAYGISFPKLQDDNLYANIDSLATFHIQEAANEVYGLCSDVASCNQA